MTFLHYLTGKKVTSIGSLKCPSLIVDITKIPLYGLLRKQLNETKSEAK